MNKKGFTLLELIFVILIIGLLISIVSLSIVNYQIYSNIENETLKLVSNLRKIQSDNISNKAIVSSIDFDILNSKYTVNDLNNSDTYQLPDNFKILFSPVMISFNKKGLSLNSLGDTIVFTDSKYKSFIFVKPVTGSINYKIEKK